MALDSSEFVGFVANSAVVSYRDPILRADGFQPFLVGAIGWEVVAMPLDVQTRSRENIGKARA